MRGGILSNQKKISKAVDRSSRRKVLPKDRPIIGKQQTIAIGQDKASLGRMTKRTKVASKKEEMVDASIRLCCALITAEIFQGYQKASLSLFYSVLSYFF